MASLTIAGITVPVARGGFTKKAPERTGSSTRAYAGSLRSTWRVAKRNWQATTPPMSETDCAAVEAAVALGVQVTCAGTVLGGSVTCEVEVGDGPYVPLTNATFRRVLVLTLREV